MIRIENKNHLSPTLTTRCDTLGVAVEENVKVIGGVGEKKSNGGKQFNQQNRIYDNKIGAAIVTSNNPFYVGKDLRIRKLTPKECFRLMGVYDEEIDRILVHQSNYSAYHLAGDSIVVNVLINIFKEMI